MVRMKTIWKIIAIVLCAGIAAGILGMVYKLEASDETDETEPIPNVTHALYIDGYGETICRITVVDVKTGEAVDILAGAPPEQCMPRPPLEPPGHMCCGRDR